MQDFYQNGNLTAAIEQQATGDYMVSFTDSETGQSQYETFHTLKMAQDAASRWIVNEYVPL